MMPMAGQPSIRIRKKDKREYRRLRKNAQEKIRRVQNKYGVDLRDQVRLPSIESFETRKEFNQWKKQIKSFTNPANLDYQFRMNKQGVVATKKEIQQAKRHTKQAQRLADRVKKKFKDKPYYAGGKQHGTYGKQQQMMGRPTYGGIIRPKDFNFEDIETRHRFEQKAETMEKRANKDFYKEQMSQMQSNFIDAMYKQFNSDAEETVQRIRQIPSQKFYQMVMMYDEMDFEFVYSEFQQQKVLERINSYIDRFEKNKSRFDLSIF